MGSTGVSIDFYSIQTNLCLRGYIRPTIPRMFGYFSRIRSQSTTHMRVGKNKHSKKVSYQIECLFIGLL